MNKIEKSVIMAGARVQGGTKNGYNDLQRRRLGLYRKSGRSPLCKNGRNGNCELLQDVLRGTQIGNDSIPCRIHRIKKEDRGNDPQESDNKEKTK